MLFRNSIFFRRTRLHRLCRRNFTVLAFESSADDTCAAIVTSERQILANVVVTQYDQHEKNGGIDPFGALLSHQKNLPVAVRKALRDAGLTMSEIDGIAFTRGPGMSGGLSVGSNAAKTLAAALNKPLVGVHHMAHALTALLTSPPEQRPQFPFLTLLVSGGHTLLLLASSLTKFRTLATTVDESIGHAFDRASCALALPWSTVGPGAALEKFCLSDPPDGDEIPHIEPFNPVMPRKLAFSFAGPHSSVDRYIATHGGVLTKVQKLAIARTFQTAVIAQLEEKMTLALRWCVNEGVGIKQVVVSGGVASNYFLRQRLRACLDSDFAEERISLVFPPPALCTDNAVMIAWASMHRFLANDFDDYSIEHRAKWDIEELSAT